MKIINGVNKVFFGIHKESKERVFITKPTWDCGWYWSFGYLGNKDWYYHLKGYTNGRNINMYDALMADYELNPTIERNLWTFCELAETIYTLGESAEIFKRGGSHYTNNPCAELIKKPDWVDEINNVILPQTMQTLWDLIQQLNDKAI